MSLTHLICVSILYNSFAAFVTAAAAAVVIYKASDMWIFGWRRIEKYVPAFSGE